MSIMTELRDMALALAARHEIPPLAGIVFPPFQQGGPSRDSEFMAMALGRGAGGLSYVLLPDDCADAYCALDPASFVASRPEAWAEGFGSGDPIADMLGLAAINAICQQVMRLRRDVPEAAGDSLGMMQVQEGDRVGMVGFFPPLLKYLHGTGVELVIGEKNRSLLERYPQLPLTLDVTELRRCNKVLCTATTLLNDTLDDVLAQCAAAGHICVLGPTAGYYPDPLFARGVDVLGGRFVHDGMQLLKLIAEGRRWGEATRKLCFRADTYPGLDIRAPQRDD